MVLVVLAEFKLVSRFSFKTILNGTAGSVFLPLPSSYWEQYAQHRNSYTEDRCTKETLPNTALGVFISPISKQYLDRISNPEYAVFLNWGLS